MRLKQSPIKLRPVAAAMPSIPPLPRLIEKLLKREMILGDVVLDLDHEELLK